MKNFALSLAVASLLSVGAQADQIVAEIEDKYVNKVRNVPVTTEQCRVHQIPVYADVAPQRDQFGDILIGATIGAVIGNELSDQHGAGALGGVIGGKIAHDRAQAPSRQVVGYRNEERCELVRVYEREYVEEYSHSYVTFQVDGRRHRIRFTR